MIDKSKNGFEDLVKTVDKIISDPDGINLKLQKICDLLATSVSGYDWVGFYFVNPKKERELILGPFAGEPTDHIRINFGQGICGQAAEKEETIIIDDVSAESNYLSCNINVKSEIVIPLYKDNKIIGELDLDSHQPARFAEDDKIFLQKIADIVAAFIQEKK